MAISTIQPKGYYEALNTSQQGSYGYYFVIGKAVIVTCHVTKTIASWTIFSNLPRPFIDNLIVGKLGNLNIVMIQVSEGNGMLQVKNTNTFTDEADITFCYLSV